MVQTVALFLVWCCHPHRLAHLHLVHPEEEGQEVLKGQAHCHISTLASRWSELSSFNLQASGDTRTASLWANRETGTNAFLESLQGAGRCARAAGFHGVHAGRGLWSLVVFTGNRFTGRAGSGTRGPGPARSPPYPNLLPQPSQRPLGAALGSHPWHHGLKEDPALAASTWGMRAQVCLS